MLEKLFDFEASISRLGSFEIFDNKLIATRDDKKVQDSLNRKMWSEIKGELLDNFYTDITEEIERLRMHLPETLSLLKVEEDIGKKLEFYFQEVLREVNTFKHVAAGVQGALQGVDDLYTGYLKTLTGKSEEQIKKLQEDDNFFRVANYAFKTSKGAAGAAIALGSGGAFAHPGWVFGSAGALSVGGALSQEAIRSGNLSGVQANAGISS